MCGAGLEAGGGVTAGCSRSPVGEVTEAEVLTADRAKPRFNVSPLTHRYLPVTLQSCSTLWIYWEHKLTFYSSPVWLFIGGFNFSSEAEIKSIELCLNCAAPHTLVLFIWEGKTGWQRCIPRPQSSEHHVLDSPESDLSRWMPPCPLVSPSQRLCNEAIYQSWGGRHDTAQSCILEQPSPQVCYSPASWEPAGLCDPLPPGFRQKPEITALSVSTNFTWLCVFTCCEIPSNAAEQPQESVFDGAELEVELREAGPLCSLSGASLKRPAKSVFHNSQISLWGFTACRSCPTLLLFWSVKKNFSNKIDHFPF